MEDPAFKPLQPLYPRPTRGFQNPQRRNNDLRPNLTRIFCLHISGANAPLVGLRVPFRAGDDRVEDDVREEPVFLGKGPPVLADFVAGTVGCVPFGVEVGREGEEVDWAVGRAPLGLVRQLKRLAKDGVEWSVDQTNWVDVVLEYSKSLS